MTILFPTIGVLTRLAPCALGLVLCLCFSSPTFAQAEPYEPPTVENSAPPTPDQISLIQIAVVVVAVVMLLALAWFGINERHRFHRKHHHRREKRRKFFDFIEIKK